MKLTTKKIRLIEMTREEMEKFVAAMEAARIGRTSHYAEERLSDGSFLGVQMVDQHEENFNGKMPRAY